MRSIRFLRVGLAGTVLAAVMCLAPPLHAEEDDNQIPIGGVKFAGGVRQGFGELGDAFDLGGVLGLEAAYHPTALGTTFSFGVAWSIYFGRFGAGETAVIDETLKLVEMSFGLRVRRRIGEEGLRFVSLGSGLTIMRTNLPVPPNMERLNSGPYVALGIEQYYKSDSMISFEVRYGLITNGPASLSLILGIAVVAR